VSADPKQAGEPHAVKAITQFKMILVMIRA
jgi:hypothetical protein